jgi:hypothetical protein
VVSWDNDNNSLGDWCLMFGDQHSLETSDTNLTAPMQELKISQVERIQTQSTSQLKTP